MMTPATPLPRCALTCEASLILLRPKSATLISKRADTSRLAVFRSLWMMMGRCACRQAMPRAMSIANSSRFDRSSGWPGEAEDGGGKRRGQARISTNRKMGIW